MRGLYDKRAYLESEADKAEFVRGIANLDPEGGKKKVLGGLIAGALLSAWLKKK